MKPVSAQQIMAVATGLLAAGILVFLCFFCLRYFIELCDIVAEQFTGSYARAEARFLAQP